VNGIVQEIMGREDTHSSHDPKMIYSSKTKIRTVGTCLVLYAVGASKEVFHFSLLEGKPLGIIFVARS